LAKFKVLHRSKKNEEVCLDDKSTKKEVQESMQKTIGRETREKPAGPPIKEYDETLYSSGYAQKHRVIPFTERPQSRRRISWENAETIEQKIDNMSQEQVEKTSDQTNARVDTEKKVDFILFKKKKR